MDFGNAQTEIRQTLDKNLKEFKDWMDIIAN
jgi:hypothetical protein